MSSVTEVTPGRHVWIVNHHALVPSKDGSTGRHLNMATKLPGTGWTASLIIASTVHANGSQALGGARLRQITSEKGIPVLWVRASAYGRSTLRRFVGMFVFAFVLLLPGMTKGLQRPDVVMGSTVHPLAAWAGLRLARRYSVPFVYEIRDVWPDALVHLGKLRKGGLIARVMKCLSVRLARQAILVIAPLPNIDRYLEENNISPGKFLWVSNGIDIPREDVIEPPVERSVFTFMYLGSHGNANALDGIIEAFDNLCASHPEREFALRLVGEGPLKPALRRFAQSLPGGHQISFEDRIPQAEVASRAREADCLVASLHDSPVYEYGISPNKLFAYLHAARPVVFASSAPNNPIREAGAGFVVAGGDRIALERAMYEMSITPAKERNDMAIRGYNYVHSNFSHAILARRFVAGLNMTVEGN